MLRCAIVFAVPSVLCRWSCVAKNFTVTDMATRTPATRFLAKLISKANPTSYSAAAPSSWQASQCEPTYSAKPNGLPREATAARRLAQRLQSQSAGIEPTYENISS